MFLIFGVKDRSKIEQDHHVAKYPSRRSAMNRKKAPQGRTNSSCKGFNIESFICGKQTTRNEQTPSETNNVSRLCKIAKSISLTPLSHGSLPELKPLIVHLVDPALDLIDGWVRVDLVQGKQISCVSFDVCVLCVCGCV